MSDIIQFLSDDFVRSLGWTLLHSLWQGFLIFGIAALVTWSLRKQSASHRYAVWCGSLIVFLAVSAVTYGLVSSHADTLVGRDAVPESGVSIASSPPGHDWDASGSRPALFHRVSENATRFMESNSQHLVLFWFIGILVFLARYLGGLWYIGQVRRHGCYAADSGWHHKAIDLASKMGVKKGFRLMESMHVKVPMTVGHLKPLLLFPLGMLGSIPPEQVEAIILHELAHVYRRDYLVNLILSLMEVVFFYHPAIWMISRQVRTERENICDDLALKQLNDPIIYIKALTTMEEMNAKTPVMAQAITGNKKRLLNRVRRMIQPGSHRSGPGIGFLAVLLLFTLVLLLGAGANLNPLKADAAAMAGPPAINAEAMNTLSSGDDSVPLMEPGTAESTEMRTGRMAVVNTNAIAPDTTSKKAEAEKQAELDRQKAAREEAEHMLQEAMQQKEQAIKAYHEAMKTYQETMMDLQKDLVTDHFKWVVKTDSIDSAMVFLFGDGHEAAWSFSSKDLPEIPEIPDIPDIPEIPEFHYFEIPEPGEIEYSYRHPAPGQVEAIKEREHEMRVRKLPSDRYLFMDRGREPEGIIKQELMEDELISRGKGYIVEIGPGSMYINGEKQSREVFKKYKKLYEGIADESLETPVKMRF